MGSASRPTTASILSLTAAASLAAAAALYVGVAVSGAGAFASNVVTTATNALVEDSSLTAKRAISVTADDTSSIRALIAAISAAIRAGIAGIGVSIGLSLARNVIGGTRTVTVANFRSNEVANLVAGSTVQVTSGHVTPDLQSNDGDGTPSSDVYLLPGLTVRIVAVGGVTPAGTAQGELYRYVGTARRANLDAMNYLAADWVRVGGAPGAVYAWRGGTTSGVDLSRQNFLDTSTWRLVSADHTSGDTLTTGTLQAGDTVFIVAGPGAGDVYSYIGPDRTATSSAPIAFQTEDFRNPSAWKLANLASTPAQVRARLVNTSVAGDGSLSLQATAQPTIEAIVVAASVAVSGGGVGFALSGAGAVTLNSIAMQVEATITGDGVVHDPTSQNPVPAVRATSVTLRATDTATIRAVTGAAAISVALGAGSVALAISIAAAVNTIGNEVTAGIVGADDTVKATNGGITIAALEDATIEAISAAAAVAIGCCGTASFTISGAGALAINTILTKVNATIAASDAVTTGKVDLDAAMTGSIRAIIVAVAAAVSISAGGAAIGAALGASLAWNLIGTDVSGNDSPAEVRAVISDSSVDAGGALTADAVSSATIEAVVVAVAVALSVGGVGLGLAGAGSSAINTISSLVEASIGDSDDAGTDGDGATGVKAASISLTATDSSRIDAITGAASIAGALGPEASPWRSPSPTRRTPSTPRSWPPSSGPTPSSTSGPVASRSSPSRPARSGPSRRPPPSPRASGSRGSRSPAAGRWRATSSEPTSSPASPGATSTPTAASPSRHAPPVPSPRSSSRWRQPSRSGWWGSSRPRPVVRHEPDRRHQAHPGRRLRPPLHRHPHHEPHHGHQGRRPRRLRLRPVYQYIGTETIAASVSAPLDLRKINYEDTQTWKLVGGTPTGARTWATVDNTSIDASGALVLSATASGTILATVITVSVALAAGFAALAGPAPGRSPSTPSARTSRHRSRATAAATDRMPAPPPTSASRPPRSRSRPPRPRRSPPPWSPPPWPPPSASSAP